MNLDLIWIFSHLIFILFFFKIDNLIKFLLSGLIFTLLLFIYLTKLDTYDLVNYISYMASPIKNELGFYYLSLFFKYIGFAPEYSVMAFQALIFIALYKSIKNFSSVGQEFHILSIVIILGSVFYFLATQNIIRQGFALSLIGLSLSYYINNKIFYSIFFSLCALLIHNSSYFFICISIPPLLFMTYFKNTKIVNFELNKLSCLMFIGIVCGSVALLAIILILGGGVYLDQGMFKIGRSPSWLKLSAVLIIFLISSIFFLKSKGRNINDTFIFDFRVYLMFFLIPLATLPEAFARILPYYFLIELFFVSLYIFSKFSALRLASIISFISFGFALNVLRILQW